MKDGLEAIYRTGHEVGEAGCWNRSAACECLVRLCEV